MPAVALGPTASWILGAAAVGGTVGTEIYKTKKAAGFEEKKLRAQESEAQRALEFEREQAARNERRHQEALALYDRQYNDYIAAMRPHWDLSRQALSQLTGTSQPADSFGSWMGAEDERELAGKLREAGLPVQAPVPSSSSADQGFESWMASEDERELAMRHRQLGVPSDMGRRRAPVAAPPIANAAPGRRSTVNPFMRQRSLSSRPQPGAQLMSLYDLANVARS
jgi:hypothetical protein